MRRSSIKLEAYIVPDNHSVWKCFPGKTYRFYEIVRETNAVFLDIRGLDTLPRTVADWDSKEVLNIIAADRWERETAKAKAGRTVKGSSAVSRIDRRNFTYLKHLFLDAKKGDLVAIPAEGYRREVLIGEFLDEPGQIISVKASDEGKTYVYAGRRVRWLAQQEKRLFSRQMIDLFHTPTAFFVLPRSLNEEIYRLAYKNFVMGDVFAATFSTSKQHFSTSDSAVVGMWFNALAAVRDAVESGNGLGNKDYLDLALTAANNAKEGELAININSPGQYVLRSVGVFALVVMAMLPLSEASASDIIKNPPKVELIVVGSADSTCALRIEKAIEDYATTLGVKRLQESCKVGMRAKIEATVDTRARLKKPTKRHK